MKKLHSIAFYVLVTPAITFAASSVLAQQPNGNDLDRVQQSTQRDALANPIVAQNDQNTQRGGQAAPATTQSQSTQRDSQSAPASSQGSQSTQRDSQSAPASSQGSQSTQRDTQSAAQTDAARLASRNQSAMQNREYLSTAPANGMHLSTLMGAEVSTSGDEDVGSVDELIIDENGQIVAIVVGVGGFLGMGEKDVAIGWGHVTRTGTGDDNNLRIDVTREDLQTAPEFERDE